MLQKYISNSKHSKAQIVRFGYFKEKGFKQERTESKFEFKGSSSIVHLTVAKLAQEHAKIKPLTEGEILSLLNLKQQRKPIKRSHLELMLL